MVLVSVVDPFTGSLRIVVPLPYVPRAQRCICRLFANAEGIVCTAEAGDRLQGQEDRGNDEPGLTDGRYGIDDRVQDIQADGDELVVFAFRVHHQPVEHVAHSEGI